MKKSVSFSNIKFSSDVIRKSISCMLHDHAEKSSKSEFLYLNDGNEEITFDKISDFYTYYDRISFRICRISVSTSSDSEVEITVDSRKTTVSIKSPSEDHINNAHEIFKESESDSSKVKSLRQAINKNSKRVYFRNIIFDWKIIASALDKFDELCRAKSELRFISLSEGDETWELGEISDFSERYRRYNFDEFDIEVSDPSSDRALKISTGHKCTIVRASSHDANEVNRLLSQFENAAITDKRKFSEVGAKVETPTVFIGHGRNNQWEKLKAHLHDKHNLDVEAYETGNRAGHTIRDILESMSDSSSIAFLVLTGEDKTELGIRARQNVIHECGLFQGKLGFDRAILVVEHGVELASNFDGIQQLRFKRGRISEVFGDAVATIRREFGPI